MSRTILTLAFALLLVVPLTAAELSVVHGIPGADLGLDPQLPVDIALDGACTVEGAELGDIAGPLTVDPKTYFAEVFLADPMAPCSGTLVISSIVHINFGDTATVVAHLTPDGAIQLSKFVNDQRPSMDAGSARLVVRHVADAPAVDVWVDTVDGPPARLFSDVSNPEQVKAEVAAAGYRVILAPADVQQIVLGPVDLGLDADTGYYVYAIGTLATGSLDLIVQTSPLN